MVLLILLLYNYFSHPRIINPGVVTGYNASRRILSLIAAKYTPNPLPREIYRKFHPSPTTYEQYTGGFQSLSEATVSSPQNPTENKSCTSNAEQSTTSCICAPANDEASIKHQVNSSLKVSERHDLAMVFTCKVCDTRNLKTACRESYDKGVVVARCSGCNNLHLIADRLGWFGEPGSIEELLAARGEEVKKGSVDTLNLTLEDLAGRKDSKERNNPSA